MNNIGVIGAENISRRHLQALSNLSRSVTTLFVVETSSSSLDFAKKLYDEVKNNGSPELHLAETMNELPSNLFTVIIATSSRERASVTKHLLEISHNIKYIIFEKILFQYLADYYEIEQLLKKNKIKSWVNCFRRNVPFYKELNQQIKKEELLSFSVKGENWGITSNTIHFIDLIHFLANTSEYSFVGHEVQIVESKRKGYYDFIGYLEGNYGVNDRKFFFESSNHNEEVVFETVLKYTNKTYVIHDDAGWWSVVAPDSELVITEEEKQFMRIPFQSEMTQFHIADLINNGECNLTTFADSSRMHLPMIKYFTEIFQEHNITGCPIT
jgi:predicted dehydrogenase